MDSGYIVLAVPFFLLLIGVELLVNRARGQHWYRLHDSIASMSCGLGQQTLGLFTTALGLWCFQYIQSHYGLFAISPRSVLAWVALIFLDDFCYYVYHRASHRVNFFWATHVVHHQSEEYNLSTALRQSWLTSVTSWMFYIPLALLGFPMVMYLTVRTFNTLYQFWIHTRAVSRLGPLEWVMNTPSHHRVHHGINPRYIDKNHAGIFIIWDRLLGTFVVEDDEPVYGTVKPLQSFDPVWANLAEWAYLWQLAGKMRRVRDKLLLWIKPPEWRPADLGGDVQIPEITRAAQRKYDVVQSRLIDAYTLLTFASTIAGMVWFLKMQSTLTPAGRGLAVVELLLALWTCGALGELRRRTWLLELGRLISLAVLAMWLPAALRPAALAVTAAALGFLALAHRSGRTAGSSAVAAPASAAPEGAQVSRG